MKKLIIIPFVLFAFVLSGCTVSLNLDPDLSKVDQFTAVAEDIDAEFSDASSTFTELKEKDSLSTSDQKTIELQIEELRKAIDNFKSTEAPFLVKTAKKKAAKELNKREKTLIKIQEKAKNGEVKQEDLELMIELISDDIEIKLWNK